MTIRPQSENVLIGQISQAEYGEVDQQLSEKWNFDLNDRQVAYNQWRLNEPFKIILENGAIRSLSVDRTMTDYERNQLKVIVSQFQVDTNAQYKMEYDDNRLPQGDNNNALYKTMEPIVTGNCETIYDISPLPDYLVQSNREWVPMPELKEGGEFIQIVKTRNYSNCVVRRGYLYDITGRGDLTQYTNEMARVDLSSSESNRYVFGRGMSTQYVNQMENDYGNRRTTDRRVFKQYTNQMEEDNSSVSENKRYNTGRGVSRQYTNQMEEDNSSVSGNKRYNTGRGMSRKYTNQMQEDNSPVFGNRRYTTDRRGLKQYTNRMEENDMYRRYITGREGLRQYINDMPKDLSLSESRRIIISGSLRKYTIQSSITTNKVMNSGSNSNDLALYDYVSVTLESVVRRNSDSNLVLLNLMDIGNLVYTYDSEHQPIPMKTSYRTQQCNYSLNFLILHVIVACQNLRIKNFFKYIFFNLIRSPIMITSL